MAHLTSRLERVEHQLQAGRGGPPVVIPLPLFGPRNPAWLDADLVVGPHGKGVIVRPVLVFGKDGRAPETM